MNIKRISVLECEDLLGSDGITVIDIRDEASYREGHMDVALHAGAMDMQDFVETADKDLPVLVYCYHGHSSIAASGQLCEYGFKNVYSLDGGYEAWKNSQAKS